METTPPTAPAVPAAVRVAPAPTPAPTLAPHDAAPAADLGAEYGLSARELVVARLMLDGLKNDEIAARLGLSFYTARNHITHILRKLGVSSRTKAAAKLLGVRPVDR